MNTDTELTIRALLTFADVQEREARNRRNAGSTPSAVAWRKQCRTEAKRARELADKLYKCRGAMLIVS